MTAVSYAPDVGDFFNEPPASPRRRVPVRAHLRTVEGPAPEPGEVQRDEALEKHARNAAKKEALDYLQPRLVALYDERMKHAKRREVIYVTADDVDDLLSVWAECPALLRTISGHWKGCVFRDFAWAQVESVRPVSRRKHMKGTALPAWRPIR